MRRLLLASVLAVLLIAVGTGVAVSSDDDRRSTRVQSTAPADGVGDRGHGQRRHGGHGSLRRGLIRAVKRQVLASTAGRLGVTVPELREALRTTHERAHERYATAAGLTAEERDALEACHRGHRGRGRHGGPHHQRGAGCDGSAARSAVDKLRASARSADFAAEKQRVAADLGEALGVAPEKVLEAVRAELVARLGQAVGLGLVTAKGQELALACFDAPAGCDLQALRAEVRHPLGGGHGGRARRHR